MNSNRFFFLFALCLTLAFSVKAQEGKAEKPNIVLILTDDLGYHDVSYYGTMDLHTPQLDALVREGMRFDNFLSNSPVCSPTRAALLSGRYPDRVGVPGLIRYHPENNWGYLDPESILLPQKLKEANYHTAHIGKWNLGLETPNLPNQKGFDLFQGWLEDMMDDYVMKRRHGLNFMRLNDTVIDPTGHATDLFTDWAIRYIEEQAQDEQPFFLYLAYNAPHFPVQPPKEWLDRVKERSPELPERRAKLVAFIEHLDHRIGEVVKALKESGQYENTLIIFTGDNGGHLPDLANNGPLRDGKQSMYEGGLRVPTFVIWPGRIKAGTSTTQVNLSMDIYPTLLDLAGVPLNHAIEGRSFLNTLLGKTPTEEERVLYFTRREGGLNYGGKAYYALRKGDWKLLQNSPYQPMELYNLKNDPLEQEDLFKSEPEVVKVLNQLLMKHIQEGGKTPWQRPQIPSN